LPKSQILSENRRFNIVKGCGPAFWTLGRMKQHPLPKTQKTFSLLSNYPANPAKLGNGIAPAGFGIKKRQVEITCLFITNLC
jgi:hypothetical protein